MDAEDVVLGIVRAAGHEIACRTYLQKVAYFVSEIMQIPLGFGPHYYGPYSSTVASETDSQVAMGRLTEIRETSGGGRVLYRYGLTEEGKEYLKTIESFDPDGFRKLAAVVTKIQDTRADYGRLAYAAKFHYLLGKAGGRIRRDEAKAEARSLGWEISDPDVDTAVGILQRLDLVKH